MLGTSWAYTNDEVGPTHRKLRDDEKRSGLKKSTEGKAQTTTPFIKANIPLNMNETKVGGNFSMRTINLQGVTVGKNRCEGPTKRYQCRISGPKREGTLFLL